MIFEFLAPCILVIFLDLLIISHDNSRFVLGSILEAIFDSFVSTFGAMGGQKVAKRTSKIDAKIGIEKSSFRGGASQKLSLAGSRMGPPFEGA